ncbi:unnamed protein product [Urochloa humidicola]
MPDSADGSMQHDSSRQFPAWPVCLQTPRGLPLSPKKTQSPKKPVQAPAVANSGSPSPQTRGLPELGKHLPQLSPSPQTPPIGLKAARSPVTAMLCLVKGSLVGRNF